MFSNRIILGLGIHRPEMIPDLSKWMESCDMILLEEPSSPDFTQMLAGGIRIDDSPPNLVVLQSSIQFS